MANKKIKFPLWLMPETKATVECLYRVYKGYSRFRHIKKRRSWESTCMTLGTPFPLGMESCKQKSIAEMKKVPQNLRDQKRV